MALGCLVVGGAFADEAAMVTVPAGVFTNLYRDQGVVEVAAFAMDERPVTNAEYLEFVTEHPAWQRSRIKRLFADTSYLAQWQDDLELGPDAPPDSPVVRVSWFAARAFAEAQGKRLPTLAEWELAAQPDQSNNVTRILAWYAKPVRGALPPVRSTFRNTLGLWDLHGLVWEWVDDFNTALVTGESRADAGLERDLFCGSGALGASSFEDYAAFMRYAFRSSLQARYTVPNLGFRCARSLDR
ncbi:MAG TPA: formylglycine-generating enzyme family protein [Kiritimatiellia bacterium]|nr:formylglycine-generating enzyme family protein [Kiritimatiellia bacterium]HMP35057.1 formylglycine-generating enzyme family protein [Kiritimatiellia bacterium]